jgi:hypothetical protein
VYDEQFMLHPEIENIKELFRGVGNHLACKINGKWGIFDSRLQEVLAPIYTDIYEKDGHYIVVKDSMNTHLDKTTFKKMISTSYSVISPFEVNGLWLVIVKKLDTEKKSDGKQKDSAELLLIDSNNVIKYRTTRLSYKRLFYYTATGSILEVPSNQYDTISANLIDLKNNSVLKMPYPFKRLPEENSNEKKIITIICRNEKGMALLSAKDFNMACSFSSEDFFTHPISFENEHGKRIEGVYVESLEGARTIVGFLSTEGTPYWSK